MNCCSTKNTNLRKYTNCIFKKVLLISIIIISILIITPFTFASELNDFEEAATTENPGTSYKDQEVKRDKHDKHKSEKNQDDDWNWYYFFKFLELLISGVNEGAETSLDRVDESTETTPQKTELRQTGEPTLPFFQIEPKYIGISPNLCALDYSLEFGYGPYAVNSRHTTFLEKNPRDKLDLTQYYFLFRVSADYSWEYGIGVGSLNMHGNEHNSGFSLTFPVKIYPGRSFGIRFKPTYSWIKGNCISDYDLSIAFTVSYYSLELGYRLLKTNGADLIGTYFGFAFHY